MTNCLKYNKNVYIFYDIFQKENDVIGIGPYYPSLFPNKFYETIQCSVGNETVYGTIIEDPHKHTLIIKFEFKENIYMRKRLSIIFEKRKHIYKIEIPKKKEKEIVLGTMFKNCAKYLENWIIYHKYIGIQHFYIYDNDSNDTEILNDVCERYKEIITMTKWPFPYVRKPSGISGQTTAQNHCIYKYGDNCKWIGLTDLDEYIYSKESDLVSVLKLYEEKDIGGILMPCMWFGCSFNVEYKNDFLEKLVYRKPNAEGVGKGKGPKSFVKPENVKVFAIHRIVSGKNQVQVNAKQLRFNHYRVLTNEGNNYNQLFRKEKGCICDIYDKVKDDELANLWKTMGS
tara:strand:+ start:1587 stop:2612 length:1026 start_codon:yes stop_codon:yes gene_type:complete